MATLTLDAAAKNQPEQVENGINVAICRVSLSATMSAGDVYRIGKLPNGAIPLDAVWFTGASPAATGAAKFGTSASAELFFASGSFSVALELRRCIRRLGPSQQISLSDDARVMYEWVTMTPTALTVGHIGDLVIYYKMPGQTL
jgi:hypothetical protein